MAKNQPGFYACRCKDNTFIVDNYDQCKELTLGQENGRNKKCPTKEMAKAYIDKEWPNCSFLGFITKEGEVISIEEASPKSELTMQTSKEEKSSNIVFTLEQLQSRPLEVPRSKTSFVNGELSLDNELEAYCKSYGYQNLSKEQRAAVQSVEGKTLLFSVPGSGKTTVIIARAGYMVNWLGINPATVMNLTFTKAAATEMKNRYAAKFGAGSAPDFRTIHSLCYSVILPRLKQAGYRYPCNLIDKQCADPKESKKYNSVNIFHEVFRRANVVGAVFPEDMENVQTLFTGVKNARLDKAVPKATELVNGWEEVSSTPSAEAAQALPTIAEGKTFREHEVQLGNNNSPKAKVKLGRLYDVYKQVLEERSCMDFDDMVVYALEGLKQYPEVLEQLLETYQYWSVDEAQDTSKLQFELLDLICGEGSNLFMVGDDDQSIYSFRGAAPQDLLDYGKRPGVKTIVMDINYRSQSRIVEASKAFIGVNRNRVAKEMQPYHKETGEILIPQAFATEMHQYEYILEAAQEAVANKTSLAVLFRRNYSALPLNLALANKGIPYEGSQSLTELLKLKDIKILWNMLLLAVEQDNLEAFKACHDALGFSFGQISSEEVFEKMSEEAGETVFDRLIPHYAGLKNYQPVTAQERQENCSKKLKDKLDFINKTKETLSSWIFRKPTEIIQELIARLPAMAIESLSRRQRIYALVAACQSYATVEAFVKGVNDLCKAEQEQKKAIDELLEADNTENASSENYVFLSTMHASKGREFARVMIIDTLEEIMPGTVRDDQLLVDLEEERRLFYVAMTRAEKQLELLTVASYHGNQEAASSYIGEVANWCDEHYEEFSCYSELEEIAVPKSMDINIPQIKALKKQLKEENKSKFYYPYIIDGEPRIFSDWKKCEAAIKGKPITPYEKQLTREAAEAILGLPIGSTMEEDELVQKADTQIEPKAEEKLSLNFLQDYIGINNGAQFKVSKDLPDAVIRGVYSYLGVENSFSELDYVSLEKIINDARMFSPSATVDYSDKVAAYLAAYLPVNFYKLWKPLSLLASQELLPEQARVLELGAGPGTATVSMISFYKLLAQENPAKSFTLSITVIEIETRFKDCFEYLTAAVQQNLPANLQVEVKLYNGDAFSEHPAYEEDYNLLVESNMLNVAEAVADEGVVSFLNIFNRVVSKGYAIMIEPKHSCYGTEDNFIGKCETILKQNNNFNVLEGNNVIPNMWEINSLAEDALLANIRYSAKKYHYFNYLLVEKKE